MILCLSVQRILQSDSAVHQKQIKNNCSARQSSPFDLTGTLTIIYGWHTGMSKPATNATLSVWTVPVATNITLDLNGTDDTQSRHVTIYHTVDTGIPAVGAAWSNQQCQTVDRISIACNPVSRRFFFGAELVHAGFVITICFEAVNDQVECPRYRPNNGQQSYGVHESPVDPPPAVPSTSPAIVVSQASGPSFAFESCLTSLHNLDREFGACRVYCALLHASEDLSQTSLWYHSCEDAVLTAWARCSSTCRAPLDKAERIV